MRIGRARLSAIAAWLIVTTVTAFGGEALPTADLLLDLARDHGLNCRGAQTAADVEHVRVLLRAALRLNPRLADAQVWRHELAALAGDASEAQDSLRELLATDPGHAGAFARWLETGVQTAQTIEQRSDWLKGQLDAQSARPDFQAMVHVQLARLALAGLDRATARESLDRALALDPANAEAAALNLGLLDDDAPPDVRLRAALKFLALSPFHVDTAWQIGVLLDRYGFSDQADVFYNHAREVHRLAEPQAPLPAANLLQLAWHALDLGEIDAAVLRAKEAVAADRVVAAEAGMFLHWLLKRQGHDTNADNVREQLQRRFAEIREPGDWPVNEIAQAAWFYLTIDLQPQRALMLAEAAAARAPGDPFVTRVLGWAQLASLQTADAMRTLLPVAGKDPYAAAALAQILKAAGDDEAARRVIHDLSPRPVAGPAADSLAAVALDETATQPAGQPYPRMTAALSEFDRTVLELYQAPDRFLQAEIAIDNRSPGPGEPWWVEFTLTNRARFPITFGPQWMVNPVFLLSIDMEGDRKREFPDVLTVTLDRVRVLPPGATVKVRRTIDLGPMRRASRLTPQQLQRVTVKAILDPVRGPDGHWQPGLGGQRVSAVYFNRLPVETSRLAVRALFVALISDDETSRYCAIETLAELLGEAQRAALGRLNYRPEPVAVERLEQGLLASLGGESWESRVRALDALQVAGLDEGLYQAVEKCAEHPHWLVRLMTVRLLGARQGEAAAPRLRQFAAQDADELVRALAKAYLTSSETAAASRPAPTTTSAPAKGAD